MRSEGSSPWLYSAEAEQHTRKGACFDLGEGKNYVSEIGLAARGFVATLAGYVIARQVFHFDYAFDPRLWLAGTVGGALCVGFFGVWGTRFILQQPPLQVLREL